VRTPIGSDWARWETDTLNDIIEMNERMAAELERLSSVVGKKARSLQRALWEMLAVRGHRWDSGKYTDHGFDARNGNRSCDWLLLMAI